MSFKELFKRCDAISAEFRRRQAAGEPYPTWDELPALTEDLVAQTEN